MTILFRKLWNRVTSLIKRSYISLVSKDDRDYSVAQITYNKRSAYAQTIYPYGLNANPPVKTLALTFNVLGQEENLACIPYAAKERFKNLKEGEVIIGSPVTGSYIKFAINGDIEIYAKGKLFTTASATLMTGLVELGSGGNAIARLGDQVTVNSIIGTITSAGTNKSI